MAEPTASAASTTKRARWWEFILLPGETPEDWTDPARIWELLGDVTGPDRAELVRHAVYDFRSLIADSLQADRVFLAGDAAHVMPPFMGERDVHRHPRR